MIARRPAVSLRLGPRVLELGERTAIMGIVNVTPDSFSDGGAFFDPAAAIAHGLALAAEGADILDVGGESTRPGAAPVSEQEELRRVVPVVRELAARSGVPVSIDTTKAAVAAAALAAGASVVNDVSALRLDPALGALVARSGAALIIMHMQGTPRTMQQAPHYDDLLGEVIAGLAAGIDRAAAAGVDPERIVVDPGIGFGKTLEHNLELLDRVGELAALGRAILVGPSRKAFIGRLLDAPPAERVEGTIAACCCAAARGAHLVRVHDVAAVRRALRVLDAILRRAA
jgi:dihydropteroate synthase